PKSARARIRKPRKQLDALSEDAPESGTEDIAPQPDAAAAVQSEPESDVAAAADPAVPDEAGHEVAPEAEPAPDTDIAAESGVAFEDPADAVEPAADAVEPEADTEPEASDGDTFVAEALIEEHPHQAAQSDDEPEAIVVLAPELEAEPPVEPEPELEAEAGAEVEPELEAEGEPEPEAEAEVELEPKPEPTPEVKPAAEPEAEPEPTPDPNLTSASQKEALADLPADDLPTATSHQPYVARRRGSSGIIAAILAAAGVVAILVMAINQAIGDQPVLAAAIGALVFLATLFAYRRIGRSSTVRLSEEGMLTLVFGEAKHTFDLSTDQTEVKMIEAPGDLDWAVRLVRRGLPPVEVDMSSVDPVVFTEALRQWRPEL
ncbi:MAG: hypothetical protein WB471_00080, partial [Nocardioides sp.]